MELVLSLFPGIDLLGRAFESQGFCVVRGPDKILDQSIEDFHAPPGKFDGVIGGPPCTNYSDANRLRDTAEGDRLVREFLRVVDETRPRWWLMENVRNVPDVALAGYHVQRLDVIDVDFGGRQTRLRHIQFGHTEGWIIRPTRTQRARSVTHVPTLTTAPAGPGDRHCRRCEKQGIEVLPLRTFTPTARRRAIGNGVPMTIGRALARSVSQAAPRHAGDCVCGCGRSTGLMQLHASATCRKRMHRRRQGATRVVTLIAPGTVTDAAGTITLVP